MTGRTDTFFWRIVPVGFGTAALSGALLGLMAGIANLAFAGTQDVPPLEVVFMSFLGSSVALLYAAVAWLPLMVIWNIFLRPMKRRFGLRRGAVILSSAMALLLALSLTLFLLDLSRSGGATGVMLLIWLLATSAIAGALTHFAFRYRTEAPLTCV